jgi:tetratricopeptide (TPR) repeat protein
VKKLTNCYYCNKQIKDYGFKCKLCDKKICNEHRLPESHNCVEIDRNKQNSIYINTNENESTQLKTKLEKNETNKVVYPEIIESLLQEAEILNDIRRPGLALKKYNKIIEKNPDFAEIWYYRGLILSKLGKSKDAVKSFRKAYELEPNNPEYRKKIESVKATEFRNFLGPTIVETEIEKEVKPVKIEDEQEENNNFNYEEILESEHVPQYIKDKFTHAKVKREQFKGKIGDPLLIIKQIDLIKGSYETTSHGTKEQIVYVKIAPGFSVKVDLTNYPKRPILELPYDIKKKFGDLNEILRSLRTWKKFDNSDVLFVLNELKACIGIYGYGKVLLSRRFVEVVFQEANIHAPKEMMGFLRMDRWILWGLEGPRRYSSSPVHVQFRSDDIPRDDSVVGMVHSHTLGPAIPSDPDLKTFKMFKINMIISLPDKTLKLFDDKGRGIGYEIVDIHDLDSGRKFIIKLSEVIGGRDEKRRKDTARSMYT